MEIRQYSENNHNSWDDYVLQHPQSTLYHLSGWKNVIEKTYGHKTYYLIATPNPQQQTENEELSALSSELIIGILPLVHLKHFLFGNSLISIPFFDLGGILADDTEAEKALILEAIELGRQLKVRNIELRHIEPLSWLSNYRRQTPSAEGEAQSDVLHAPCAMRFAPSACLTRSHKVRMLLQLPESSDLLMKSFKAKLRSQIKKPLKEGLTAKIGGPELLDDFYKVFSINMRDLGSPVHSKKLMQNVIEKFPDEAKIVMIYKDDMPVAGSLIIGFKDILENPWASALREFSRLSPNMLLYWTMLEYACDNGYGYFDFGRSSPDEGTYKFKAQWGAKPTPLHWQYLYLKGQPEDSETSEKSKFDKAIQYWQKMPIWATKIIGPPIRKHIGL